MPASALVLALLAAFFHAGWNLVLGTARDVRAATTVALALSVVLLAPLAVATWDVERTAVPWIVASAALELAYFALLVAAYSGSDVSLVYPIARGSAPVLVLLGGLVLGAAVGPGQALGVVLVAGGVVLVRGLRGPFDRRGVALALATGTAIAGYTLVDNEGVEHAGVTSYLVLVLLPVALVVVVFEIAHGRAAALRDALRISTVLAAAGAVLAYGLALAALERASAAPVAAVRESSVLIVAFLGTALLGEAGGRLRVAGAALVVTGIALVALG